MLRVRLFLVVVPITLLAVLILARCGKPNASAPADHAAADILQPRLRFLKPLEDIRPASGRSCRLSQAVALESTQDFAVNGKQLWVRGGGWEDSAILGNIGKYGKSRQAVVVLSATDPNASQGSAYFYQYYQQRLSGFSVTPVFTTGKTASDPEKVRVVQQAGVIFITGGSPDRLRHLPHTPVGNAIVEAYHQGVPVYLNSASVSLAGPYFGWDIGREKSNRRDGLSFVPFPMVSHLEAPRSFQQYLSDLWRLVPSQASLGFGLTAGTLAVFSGNKVAVYGSDSSHRVYVYDSRVSPTEQCHQWYLTPGEVFPAVTE